jgi:hypothetical protein
LSNYFGRTKMQILTNVIIYFSSGDWGFGIVLGRIKTNYHYLHKLYFYTIKMVQLRDQMDYLYHGCYNLSNGKCKTLQNCKVICLLFRKPSLLRWPQFLSVIVLNLWRNTDISLAQTKNTTSSWNTFSSKYETSKGAPYMSIRLLSCPQKVLRTCLPSKSTPKCNILLSQKIKIKKKFQNFTS